MRAAPPLEFEIDRFGVWRGATLTLAAAVWAVLAAWWGSHPAPAPAWVAAAALLGMLGAAAAALPSFRLPPLMLRLRAGQCQLAVPRGAPAQDGELRVALDLGAWLLLRFFPRAAGARARWIAVQRRGLEPQWHAIRCAVHAPRRAPAEGATADV